MRKTINLNSDWKFIMPGREPEKIDIPHTWNGIDGQDGGNDYLRTVCRYKKIFNKPEIEEGQVAILWFCGVNSECKVFLNNKLITEHEGGYSSFCVDITETLEQNNVLEVEVSNVKNNRVYPQKADFTFYGGIYRDVNLYILPKNRFNFGPDASPALKLTPTVDGTKGVLLVEAYPEGEGKVVVSVLDGKKVVAKGTINEPIEFDNVRLWNGRPDPFMYTVKAQLIKDGQVLDEVEAKAGFRKFHVDPDKGFFLNGQHYPLRGVCRHQDRPRIGNAISKEHHEEDIDLIMEIGATTVRLAHYQHDQYFYDLCDQKGLVVWAEIPYISKHMPTANQNAYSQMRELVRQNYNHPSIVCWGLSNEITISPISKDTVECHKKLHELCHEEDPTRLTAVACYMPMMKSNPTAHISDLVSYNLYFGWYFPFTALAGWKLDGFHKKYPNRPLGLSEYGAEAMPNLHSAHPRRLDNTEEYHCLYHEQMLKIIQKRDYLWATHVWNMFDFAADARNQGGEPGMNHKGLVTFDRKTKKDSFYLYKAYWTNEKFVHIASKRFVNRTGKSMKVKVYSNCDEITLYHNGNLIGTQKADKVFEWTVPLEEVNNITAVSGGLKDEAVFYKVQKPDPSYKLKKAGVNKSWEK